MKKQIVFWSLCISLVVTTFLYSTVTRATSTVFRNPQQLFLPTLATLVLLVYYIRLDKNTQLVPATVKNKEQKKKQKDETVRTVTFKDVAGLDEVKEELAEIIDFIKNSEKYRKMGAKIPRGTLFYGPPGTGKTLMASAVAGESNANFIYASGSEFVEKYVGVGASRIRELFEKAVKNSPSVVFIDEIDAIGSTRNIDNNSEKDQTLNQLLVEMDGFNAKDNVVVIGATNRIDLLDPALLRPGRFDRHMYIGNPNVGDREEILKVHTRDKPLDETVNIKEIARKTHGMSGAHLANIANEAAILAVRNNKSKVSREEFNQAIERVMIGLQKKNATIVEREKQIVAFHEAGHALVSRMLNANMIEKISIVPRGQSMGYVLNFPDEDRFIITKKELKEKIAVFLGGRAAEEIVFGEITTGAKDDLTKATEIAQQMVCEFGMGNLGSRVFDHSQGSKSNPLVEKEIKLIIDESYDMARTIIMKNREYLSQIAEQLIEKETISGEDLNMICNF